MNQRDIADGRRVGGAWPDALLTAAAWALPTAFILVPLLLFLTLGFFEVQGTGRGTARASAKDRSSGSPTRRSRPCTAAGCSL